MKIIELIRLILKHLRLLIAVPIILASLVILLTLKPSFDYSSQTVLYTGLASGSTIEIEKTFNYFATNTAFDNLLNIIKSRETQEEVGIRLLSQHLMLPKADPKYLSSQNYNQLKEKIPSYIYNYVSNEHASSKSDNQPINEDEINSHLNQLSNLFPHSINKLDYEKTVKNLTALMKSSDTNFVYEILNYEDDHYSLKALSEIKAERISNSDLIKLSYQVNDPGVCQQTLAILNEVCIKNYKNVFLKV